MKTYRSSIFFIIALLSALVLTGCATSRPLQLVERTSVDTLYLSSQHYDSIYVSRDHFTDRSRDTVYIKDSILEYRYKLLRDTVYQTRVDSIPILREVEVVREVPRKRNWIDYLCYTITAILSGLLLIRVLRYLRGR